MKKLYSFITLTIAVTLGFALLSLAKPMQDVFLDFESAVAAGNAKSFSNYLSSSVELELPGEEEGIYSKQQTIVIYGRFRSEREREREKTIPRIVFLLTRSRSLPIQGCLSKGWSALG